MANVVEVLAEIFIGGAVVCAMILVAAFVTTSIGYTLFLVRMISKFSRPIDLSGRKKPWLKWVLLIPDKRYH